MAQPLEIQSASPSSGHLPSFNELLDAIGEAHESPLNDAIGHPLQSQRPPPGETSPFDPLIGPESLYGSSQTSHLQRRPSHDHYADRLKAIKQGEDEGIDDAVALDIMPLVSFFHSYLWVLVVYYPNRLKRH
jgi:hypothetical protein